MKGPTFCPSTSGTFHDAKAETSVFTRKLKLREKYFNCDFKNEALVKEKSTEPVTTNNSELKQIIEQIESIAPEKITMDRNLTREETRALNSLKTYDNIVIKKQIKEVCL